MIRKNRIGSARGVENEGTLFWLITLISQKIVRINVIIVRAKNFGYRAISVTFEE